MRCARYSVHDDDVSDLAEPVAHGVEDGAPGQARDENPLCAHASSVVREVLTGRVRIPAWDNGPMSMLNRPADGTDVGQLVASARDYESAQKMVSKLIAGEVPARDIAIVGQGVRTIERITGRLGYAVAARSGAINGVLIGLFLSAVLVLGNPEAPIQLFVGFVLIGVALGMILSLVTFSIVRRRRDFASVTQMAADHYEVTVQAASLAKAREVLGQQRPAPVRPQVNLDEPPRYGERIAPGADTASGAGTSAPDAASQTVPAGHAIPPRPADPAPRYGERNSDQPADAAGEEASEDASETTSSAPADARPDAPVTDGHEPESRS